MLRNKCRLSIVTALAAMSLLVVSCGSSKALQGGTKPTKTEKVTLDNAETMSRDFLRKVYDNEVYANSITSKIKFTVNTGSKDISVSGSLNMKKDQVIRIQLTPFGLMEVGRLEFTKDYVLIMDRMNKEYIKASYADVDFLQKNGLDFYTLQALFWNKLFVPGTQKITDSSLKNFSVAFNNALSDAVVSYKRGDMSYAWSADKTTALIKSVGVTYDGKTSGKTTVTCEYGKFKPLGTKLFPTDITLKLKTGAVKNADKMSVNISINNLDTSDDWDTFTTVSGKYKQVDVQDVVKRLMKM